MIALTRLDGTEILLNADLVEWVERTPDTLVCLTNGERVMVKETPEELRRRVIEFRRAIVTGPGTGPADGQGGTKS